MQHIGNTMKNNNNTHIHDRAHLCLMYWAQISS